MPDRRITDLIQSAATRSAHDTAVLASALAGHCWPGGGDRRDPVATEWLRRWAPVRMPAQDVECACATGRCGSCN